MYVSLGFILFGHTLRSGASRLGWISFIHLGTNLTTRFETFMHGLIH